MSDYSLTHIYGVYISHVPDPARPGNQKDQVSVEEAMRKAALKQVDFGNSEVKPTWDDANAITYGILHGLEEKFLPETCLFSSPQALSSA